MPSLTGMNARAKRGETTTILNKENSGKLRASLVDSLGLSDNAILRLVESADQVAIITSYKDGAQRIVGIRASVADRKRIKKR